MFYRECADGGLIYGSELRAVRDLVFLVGADLIPDARRLRVRFAVPPEDRPEFLQRLRTLAEGLPIAAQLEWDLCEADETACKMARRWGYRVKGIPSDQAMILFPTGNFWGRSITASGACDDPSRYTDFGPFTAGFDLFKYDDLVDLKAKLEANPNICAVCVEPIQGEGGVIIPSDGYL